MALLAWPRQKMSMASSENEIKVTQRVKKYSKESKVTQSYSTLFFATVPQLATGNNIPVPESHAQCFDL